MSDYDDEIFFNEDDRKQYQTDFVKAFDDWAEKKDPDYASEILSELQAHHNVKHSDSGYTDSQLNILRAENSLKKKHTFDRATESFLRYQAQADGKTLAQVKREARKLLGK